MQLSTNNFSPSVAHVPGSGGFMDPERIAAGFGLTEGMRVADFGSGAGYFTIIMAKMVGDNGLVTAVDLMNFALETLRTKAKVEGLGNIQTVRSNLEVLGSSGLANDSQDVVLLANILFQIPYREPKSAGKPLPLHTLRSAKNLPGAGVLPFFLIPSLVLP